MAPRTAVMEAVEKLNYRVTIGDVAAQSGLSLNAAQREVLALASETGGNIQVAESVRLPINLHPISVKSLSVVRFGYKSRNGSRAFGNGYFTRFGFLLAFCWLPRF
jgi:hypothetical protein